uniref:Uncharacterized protein n=1 Tax=Oryza meridionalis TaxID=40149 RepID=A0A0E0F461_9ORYZ
MFAGLVYSTGKLSTNLTRYCTYRYCNSDNDCMSPESDPDNPKLDSLLQTIREKRERKSLVET